MKRLIQYLFFLIFSGAIVAVGGGLYLLNYYSRDLPDYGYLADYQPPVVTRVHAGDGRLLAEFATEKRVFIPISAVPRRVIQAFLSAEDKTFYEHGGLDPMGLLRAVLTNVENFGSDRRPVGASTITQQVAKNFLLTNEVSLARKIKEAVLAIRIEQAFSKDRILELYLNEIFLGNRSYGIAAAAVNYFNKSLDELTIAEVAYLAALPKAPNNYHPERNRDAAVARRNWVISRMQEDGHINAEEAQNASQEALQVRKREDTEYVTADTFAEEVRRELVRRFNGEKAIYEGGLSVRTSLDPTLQVLANKTMRAGLVAYDRRHGWRGPVSRLNSTATWATALTDVPLPAGAEPWRLAAVLEVQADGVEIGLAGGQKGRIPWGELRWARPQLEGDRLGPEVRKPADVLKAGDVVLVEPVLKDDKGKDLPANTFGLRQMPAIQGGMVVMDPHTGRVLAMSGGFSSSTSQFNRATQALRQPGSSFKPFVYLTALENGFTPSSLVLDAPFEFQPGPGQPVWRPENYSQQFYGPTPLRVGIEKSRNVMTVRLAHHLGMDKVAATAERFGIVDKLPPYLPMALGAGETTVLRLTSAYAMLANGGKRIIPSVIDRVQDRNGKTVYRHDERPCQGCSSLVPWGNGLATPAVPDTREQIADPGAVYQIVSMMEGVIQRGTGAAIASLGRPLAGKTGTTNDAKDVWFVGFSPDLAVGLYLGFDQPRSLGAKETGGGAAVPVFKAFMAEALKDKPPVAFRVPKGMRLVKVNPATGQLAQPGEKGAIYEAFKPGTEPGDGPAPILDGSGGSGTDPGNSGGEIWAAPAFPGDADPNAPALLPAGGGAPLTAPSPSARPGNTAPATTTGTGGLY